jgi:hypothetical protein
MSSSDGQPDADDLRQSPMYGLIPQLNPDQIDTLVYRAKHGIQISPRRQDIIEAEWAGEPDRSVKVFVFDYPEVTDDVLAQQVVEAALQAMQLPDISRPEPDEMVWDEAKGFLPALRSRGIAIDNTRRVVMAEYLKTVTAYITGVLGQNGPVDDYHPTQIGYERLMAFMVRRAVISTVKPIILAYLADVRAGRIVPEDYTD